MMDWSMMDWMVRSGMVDGSMTNPEISLLPPSRIIVLSARLVSRDWLLQHLHLQLQVVSGGHDGQRDGQERYEELLATIITSDLVTVSHSTPLLLTFMLSWRWSSPV